MELWLEWDTCWQELIPKKEESYSDKKKSLPWLSLASGLEKYLKHASQILLSYGKKMCTPMKMAYIQVGPCRQWFMVCIVPACELVILVKEVESCLWRQDFPGTQETGSAGSWGLSPPSSTAPIPGPVHHWNTNSRWDFICWNVFKTAGFWSFKSLFFTRSKDYLANYGCVQKCSHPQSDLSLFSLWFFFSENKDTFWRHNIHLQFKKSALKRSSALLKDLVTACQILLQVHSESVFIQAALLISLADSLYGLSLLINCKSIPSKIQYDPSGMSNPQPVCHMQPGAACNATCISGPASLWWWLFPSRWPNPTSEHREGSVKCRLFFWYL